MKKCLFVLVLGALASSIIFAQAPKSEPPKPQPPELGQPPQPLPEVKPEQIKGNVTNAKLTIKQGEMVPAGGQLVIEFDYETDAPGTAAVAIEVMPGDSHPEVNDGAHIYPDPFSFQPFELSEKKGKGKVIAYYSGYGNPVPTISASEIKLFLFPISGSGRRDVATIKGPVKFEGTELFTAAYKERIAKLEKDLQELQKAVERLQQKSGAK